MLTQKLQEEQITALKSHNTKRLNTIRYLIAQIKNKEIEKKETLTDEEVIVILKKQQKEIRESIESFEKGGRKDLVGEYMEQLIVVQSYLPAEINDEILQKEIQIIIEKNKDLYQKNPKALMGICVKELRSKADPQRIIQTLKDLSS
jgi:hypothetical protein